jgi:hypothetical protein
VGTKVELGASLRIDLRGNQSALGNMAWRSLGATKQHPISTADVPLYVQQRIIISSSVQSIPTILS